MKIQIIRLQSSLEEQELLHRAKEREPLFQKIPGLLQKYYVKLDEPNQYGGIYIWESQESLDAFRASDLAASIPQAYEITKAPDIELLDVLFKLRDK
ncbi:MAG: YdhR family protein [Saprospiraceae bacterium]|nr:YdhR family protein [Saprospiraceae bacterium]